MPLGMLRQRLLTSLVLIPPLIAAVFWLPPAAVAALFGAFIAAAAWEWSALAQLGRQRSRLAYTGIVLAIGTAAVSLALSPVAFGFAIWLLTATVAFWLWMLLELSGIRAVPRWLTASTLGKYASGMGVLIPVWTALVLLHRHDPDRPYAVLFLLALVWAADTAAYFSGHACGRVKLAPAISPGKTVEGAAGGLVAVLLLAYLGGTLIWRLEGGGLAAWLGLCLAAGLFSVLGDLTESRFKRLAGVKDSGRLLPGHGGVLDRIDALSAAAPVFALGWILFFQVS